MYLSIIRTTQKEKKEIWDMRKLGLLMVVVVMGAMMLTGCSSFEDFKAYSDQSEQWFREQSEKGDEWFQEQCEKNDAWFQEQCDKNDAWFQEQCDKQEAWFQQQQSEMFNSRN